MVPGPPVEDGLDGSVMDAESEGDGHDGHALFAEAEDLANILLAEDRVRPSFIFTRRPVGNPILSVFLVGPPP